jgi:hypothetical protein
MSNEYGVPSNQIHCDGKCHKCQSRHCGDISNEIVDAVTGAKAYWRNPEYVWWRVWIAKQNQLDRLVQLRMEL